MCCSLPRQELAPRGGTGQGEGQRTATTLLHVTAGLPGSPQILWGQAGIRGAHLHPQTLPGAAEQQLEAVMPRLLPPHGSFPLGLGGSRSSPLPPAAQRHEVPWGKGKADISPPSKAPMRIEMHGSTRARLSFLDISRDSKLSSITSLQLALPKSPGEGLALLINETQGRRGRTRPLCSWKRFKRPGLGAGGTPRRSPRGFVGWETSVSVSTWFGSRVEEGRGITKMWGGEGWWVYFSPDSSPQGHRNVEIKEKKAQGMGMGRVGAAQGARSTLPGQAPSRGHLCRLPGRAALAE